MKNKAVTYLLIVGVAAVWGIIFHRVYVSMTSDVPAPLAVATVKKPYFNEVNHDTAKLVMDLNYRDPFAKNDPTDEIVSKTVGTVLRSVAPVAVGRPIDWSVVVYKGYITNPTSKRRVAIMQLLGKETMMIEGQEVSGVKLVRFAVDSIQVKYQGVLKYIKLK